MRYPSNYFLLTVWLLAICFIIQSCSEQGISLEKQMVQFTLNPASTESGQVNEIDLPENAHAIISITSSTGGSDFTNHEVAVSNNNGVYVTDRMELTPGSYTITDFMIVKDSIGLYVAPKKGAELATSLTDALPFNFSVSENNDATVAMHVMDVRSDDLERFGYTSAKT